MESIKLTKDQLLVLISSTFPIDRANVLAEAINNKFIICNDKFYVLDSNNIYKVKRYTEKKC